MHYALMIGYLGTSLQQDITGQLLAEAASMQRMQR